MKFERACLPSQAFDVKYIMETHKVDERTALHLVEFNTQQTVFLSDKYQVNIRESRQASDLDWPPMLHLSIKRRDKEPIHDWREMQEIKNALCGKEAEGVELYPAESRLTDTANQYHMWVLKGQIKFPFGFFDGRNVTGVEDAVAVGAKQREP
jgi:hypothetical protein